MGRVRLALLWHMHQPPYQEAETGDFLLPWVRLHATRAYFDMAWILERHPGVHCTVNFTPLRYQTFYAAFVEEFPHLKKVLPLRDVSLMVNLWEEWKIKNEGGPASTASGAPPPPLRDGRGPRRDDDTHEPATSRPRGRR